MNLDNMYLLPISGIDAVVLNKETQEKLNSLGYSLVNSVNGVPDSPVYFSRTLQRNITRIEIVIRFNSITLFLFDTKWNNKVYYERTRGFAYNSLDDFITIYNETLFDLNNQCPPEIPNLTKPTSTKIEEFLNDDVVKSFGDTPL